MLGSVLTVSFFSILGISWRFLSPGGISAESLQRGLTALIHLIILPVAVFFIVLNLPLNEAALRMLLYILATSGVTLAMAWVWLWKSKLPGKSKGALLVASAFGNVFFLGVPLNQMFFSDWTMRVAVEYGLVCNVLLLFTAGAVLSRSLTTSGKQRFQKAVSVLKDYQLWLQEPLLWSALLGLVLNLAGLETPSWLKTMETVTYGALVPLLLISTALALNWHQNWNKQIVKVLPAAAIQLVATPLVMWAMAAMFGSAGVTTTKTLLLDSMMPATVFGIVFCERYKLDTGSYALAFTVTTALAVVTVPVWFNTLL